MSETNTTTVPQARTQAAGGPPVVRQFVNFGFYKLDPAFRRLPSATKEEARAEFVRVVEARQPGLMCLTYSTVGLQEQSGAINRTTLGGYLTTPHSMVAMTKRSMYIDKVDPFHTQESRTHIIPGKRKYLFVYPFVKTRPWFLLSLEKRQEIMDNHIRIGNKYPSVKLNTTYSFGLDDQEFVVAFETEEPKDFLDLVMELRETESSLYTLRDTPIFTCVQMGMEKVLGMMF